MTTFLLCLAAWLVACVLRELFIRFVWNPRFYRRIHSAPDPVTGRVEARRVFPLNLFYVEPRTAIPRWFGIATYDHYRDEVLVLPLPLNFIVRWGGDALFWARVNILNFGWRKRMAKPAHEPIGRVAEPLVLCCDEQKTPLQQPGGICALCGFAPDMQSTVFLPAKDHRPCN